MTRLAQALGLAVALAALSVASVASAASPPNAILLDGSEVAENLPVGTPVGGLTALDSDPDETFVFVVVENPANAFRVGSDGVTLETAKVLDFEARPSYGIRVRATDSLGLYGEQYFTITVVDANDPPLGVALSPAGIGEDRPPFSVVGTLAAIGDQDQNEHLTFALIDDAGGAFVLEGTQLVTAAVLDHEDTPSLDVLVRVTDHGGLSAEDWLTVSVYDRNEPPTGVALAASPVPESAAPGTLVGALSVLGDPDVGDAHTFSLVDAGAAPFAIIAGAIRTTGALDFESRPTWSLTVRVTDLGGLRVDAAVLIAVADVNEPPTGATLTPSSVHELVPPGTLVGALSAVDPDAGDGATFSLIGPGPARFALQGGFVVTAAALDFEAAPVEYVPVRVTDAAGASTDALLPVTVVDDNEAPTAVAIDHAAVFEDAYEGATIGALSATDPDAGDAHHFTLVGDEAGRFGIQGDTLRLARKVDFEAAQSYVVRVRATDLGGLWVERDLTIAVRDVDEAPAGVALDHTHVDENLPAGTLVGQLSAVDDPDQGDAHTFTLVQNGGGALRVVGSRLETTGPLDAEAGEQLGIRVRVTDSGGLSAESSFTITVEDVDEPPTGLRLSASMVAEGRPAGQWIGQLTALGDPDRSESFTFEIVEDAAGAVVLSGDALSTARPYDFETERSLTVRVRVIDRGGLSVEAPLTLLVLDQNEAPTGITIDHAAIAEGAPAGTLVGLLRATGDPDQGDAHTFQLWDSAGGRFSVDGDRLVTDVALDYEADPSSYRVQVEARDRGGLSVQRTINIALEDVNEPPSGLALTPSRVAENQPAGAVVGQLSPVGDPDGADTWVFRFVGEIDEAFAIVGDRVVTRAPLDFEARTEHLVEVAVTDGAGQGAAATFAIAVDDLPEPPVGVTLVPDHLVENARPGAVVGLLTVAGDPDHGDTHTIEIVDDPDALFAIDPHGRLTVGRSLDFEAADRHDLTVRATDATGLHVDVPLTVRVDDVDDAPRVTPADVVLTPMDEDEPDPPGDAVADLLAGLEISDQDPGPILGVLITAVDATEGRWEARAEDGAWAPVDALPLALAAVPGRRVRFVPGPDFNGELTSALTFRVWDGLHVHDGAVVAADAVATSGAFSSEELSASLEVLAVNDAPMVVAPEGVVTAWEHAPVRLASGGTLAVSDVDASALDVEVSAPGGGVSLPTASGVTVVGGTAGGPLLTFGGTTAAVNRALEGMTFTPAPGLVGETEVVVTALDRGQRGAGGPRTAYARVRVSVVAAPDMELQRGQVRVQGGGEDVLGVVGAGTTLQLAYTVRNRGDEPLHLDGTPPIVVAGATNAVTLVTVAPPATLAPAEEAWAVVTLTPIAPGPLEAELVAACDDPDEAPFRWRIRGTATGAAELGFVLADRRLLDAVPVDLGALPIDVESAIPVQIVNDGSVMLEVGAIHLVSREACEVWVEEPFPDIDPGGRELMRVHLEPVTAGAFSARIGVSSNDPAGARVLWLRGRGVGSGANGVSVTRVAGVPLASGGDDDVGEILVGGEGSYVWTVANAGLRPVVLEGITVGDVEGVEVEAQVVGGVIPVGGEALVLARLVPAVDGPFRATLELATSSAPGGRFTWTVMGAATPEARPLPRWWRDGVGLRGDEDDVGAVAVGDGRQLVYQLENGGAAGLWLDAPVYARELDNVEVRVLRQPPQVLGPGGDAAPVVVQIRPIGPGPLAAVLVAHGVADDTPVERTLRVRSSGQAPQVAIRHGDRALGYGDAITLPLADPGAAVDVTLTVVDVGTAPLSFTGTPKLSGDEACLGVTAPEVADLGPGDETPLTVTLSVTPGPFSCRLEVYTSAPDRDGVYAVEIHGHGRMGASGTGCGAGGDAPPAPLRLVLAAALVAMVAVRARRRARR